jgi:hypothetical protein
MSNWLKAKCPICNDEYMYTSRFKPATCSKYECVHKWYIGVGFMNTKECESADELLERFRWKQLNKLVPNNVVPR